MRVPLAEITAAIGAWHVGEGTFAKVGTGEPGS